MWFPDERRLEKIKMDIKRIRELGADPVRIAGWLTDFVIKVQLENLKKKYPDKTREELMDILRHILIERDRDEL
ncbi:MAG: hypothetical protein QXO71_02515 [Candidatus Jordarchaeaceae archaeon]